MDSDDEAFVNKLKKKIDITALQFEEMIDRLEKGSGQQLVTLQEAKLLLKEDDDLIWEVYEYWIRKRKNCRGCSLIPTVKQEKRDGSSTNDPYVAFRRRTEKMQTRKNRKNDEASYEKMLKLRRDLSRAVTILEMIKRREKSKRELLHLTLEIVEKRHSLGDFSGEILSEVMAQRQHAKPTYAVPIIPISNSNQFKHQDFMEFKEFKVNKQENVEIIRPKRKYEKKKHKISQPIAAAPQQTSPAALPVFNAKDINQYDFPSSDEEPFSQVHSASSEAEEENDPDGPFAFRRKAGCQYYSPRLDQTGNWPWCSPEEGGLGDVRYRYCLTTLTVPRRCIGFARRRVGRGGRNLLDRAHTANDILLHQLDPEILSSPPHSAFNEFANTSQINTSDHPSRDLTQILASIKACRWRHFRPRSPNLQDNDGDELSSRKLYRGVNRIVTAQLGTQPCSTSVSSKSSGTGSTQNSAFTAEQYQQHQQQLVLMQKQQLAQIQQQLAHSNSGSNSSQGSVSKTLDSVSAQFAASALMTSEQLMAYKAKEEVVLGINGVLQASGSYKGLHLTSTMPTALVQTSQSSSSSAGSALLPSCSNTQTTTSHTALSHHGNTTNSSPQVLLGNSLRIGVPSSVSAVNSVTSLNARHIPRTLNTVPTAALKLASAANCQVPKVAGSTSMDGVPRENHDTEKPALNSIADNTVAMEVT
ncbi:enhancer of polycomb homolog 1-like isoform X4 [Rhinoraja longicauda]